MCKYSFRKSVMNTFRKVVKVCFQSHLNMRKSYLTCDLLLHCSFLKLLKNVLGNILEKLKTFPCQSFFSSTFTRQVLKFCGSHDYYK